MLVDGDVAPGEGEVVIGGEEGDQAEGEAADGLDETEAIEVGPRRGVLLAILAEPAAPRCRVAAHRRLGEGTRGWGGGGRRGLLPSMPPLSQHGGQRPQETAQPCLPVAPCGCCHLILGAICESNPIPLPHPANFPSEFGVVIHKLNLELRKPLQPYLTLIERVL